MEELLKLLVQLLESALLGDQNAAKQVIELLEAAANGDLLAAQLLGAIEQAAQLGDQQASKIWEAIQSITPQQSVSAKYGAKLNYLKHLRGSCPEGQTLKYFKKGGRVCSACMKALSLEKGDAVEEFKKKKKLISLLKK